jgi:hypothetical protein
MSEPQGYTQAVVDILNSQLGQSITQAFTAGEEHERKRIISLLSHLHDEYTDDYGYTMESMAISNAIDRIKGITK